MFNAKRFPKLAVIAASETEMLEALEVANIAIMEAAPMIQPGSEADQMCAEALQLIDNALKNPTQPHPVEIPEIEIAAKMLFSSVYGNYFVSQIEGQGDAQGNLVVNLTPEGKEACPEARDIEQAFEEYVIADKGWQWVAPEQIGAMTSAPIFGDVSMNDQGDVEEIHQIWWYPEYETKNYAEELLTKGTVKFTHAE